MNGSRSNGAGPRRVRPRDVLGATTRDRVIVLLTAGFFLVVGGTVIGVLATLGWRLIRWVGGG